MTGRAAKGAALAALTLILAATALVAIREPVFFERYVTLLWVGAADPPAWFYRPVERIEGGSAAPLPRVSASEAGIEPAALERAAEYAAARNTRALLVARQGHLVYEKYWAGTGFATPANADAFAGTLAALAVGIALGEGRITSLEDPASKYLTEWRGDVRGAITIRNLLQMSSGLAPSRESYAPWSARMHQLLGTDITAEYLKVGLTGRAGLDWSQKGVDPELLALIVERASGHRYAEWLSQKLWKPLDAGDATLFLDRTGGSAHAECCLLARQGDWLRVAALLLGDGVFEGTRILPPGWVRAMLTPAAGNANYGFQLWLGLPYAPGQAGASGPRDHASRASEPYAADDLFLLEGAGKERLWLVPSLQLAILRSGGNPAEPDDWDDARIPNLIIRGLHLQPGSGAGTHLDLSKIVPGH